ncbi:SusC/RagA family TonB-linked outer membrane protein [Siphonobacter sp. SORGH_AS_0500]|uniref:SusC/RagA family TonB-linked outer membrane protein n=1 Tax=Siphonobacter sp. SORGH_AS_0500 TaxID=1864824 RepID=UPI00286624E2|nr:SusC/RagA family TonB-linked outer membrane protein [Siphonobacter sp. SORGH_AS_0500]MDR6197855.1 TonB-linked SusC/RagA family outer membrane protein [Siphonobacter sp. SORGH_AS_0500]
MKKPLLFLVCLLLTGPVAFAQQRITLNQALVKIQAFYGTKFSYAEHLTDNMYVQLKTPLSKNQPVENVLKEILYPNKLLFLYVQHNYYTLIKDTRDQPSKNRVEASAPGYTEIVEPESAYIETIRGTITDSHGKPLIGATIKSDRGNVGVTANSDGQYTLRLTQPTQHLTVSFVGMVTQRVAVGNRTMINVILEENTQELKQIEILSTGYQKIPKERATGSFSQVTKEIKDVPSINLMERLEGAMPGVNFNVRKNTIQIRGVNSFGSGANTNPLIVIDGFPAIDPELTSRGTSQYTAGAILSRYNPEDIASITVLKDAAATSIWGAQAANGVIVIETKKGRPNTSSINFSTNLSISRPANLSSLTTMSSAEYIALEKELKDRGFYSDPTNWDSSWMNFNQNRPLSDALEWMFRVDRGTATVSQRDSALSALAGINNQSQIRKLLLQNAISQQYNLSLSGGGPNSTYYLSTNYSKDIPVFRSNQSESYFVTANLGNQFFQNRLRLNTSLNYNISNSINNSAAINAITTSNLGLRPYESLEDAQGNHIQRYYVYRQDVAQAFEKKGYLPYGYNPIDELNYSKYTTQENRLRFGADLTGKLTDWLDLTVAGQWQRNLVNGVSLDELQSYNMRNRLNYATSISPTTGSIVYGIPFGGSMISRNQINDSYSLRGQFNINKSWHQFAQLNMVAGSEIRQTFNNAQQQTRYGYNADTRSSLAFNPSVAYTTIDGYSSILGYNDGAITYDRMRYLSYYSNAGLSFLNNRYSLSASIRFDDYSLAGISRSRRARPLWSTGVKWNIKSESFMNTVSFFDDLQLRLTYGIAGIIPTATSNSTLINTFGADNLTNEAYASISTPANSQLSWEKTASSNIGLDFALLNNRLSGNFDVYQKKSTDILGQFPYNSTYGWSTLKFNSASMENHGYELGLKAEVIQYRGFRWSSAFNVSYNTNKVTDTRFNQTTVGQILSNVFLNGMPTDYLYAYRWAGLDNRGQGQIYNKSGEIVSDQVGVNSLTREDLVYVGRTTAPYFGAFINNFSYKGWTLAVRFTYAMGHVFRRPSIDNYPDYQATALSGLMGTQKDLALRWQKPGDEAFTNVPGLANISYNSVNRYKLSDLLTESASHIRFQQLSLGYQLGESLLKKLPVKSASLNVTARNLGLIWVKNKAGVDPEYYRTNNYANLPPVTSFFFGLNASF